MKLSEYIKKAQAKGLDNDQIKQRLVVHGWDPDVVAMALGDDDLPVPSPPDHTSKNDYTDLSVNKAATLPKSTDISLAYSLQYIIMLLSLWFSAIGAGGILHNVIDYYWGEGGGDLLSPFFGACLIVGLPIYLILYILIKKEEGRNVLVLSSRARKITIALTIIIAFLIGVTHLIIYVINLLTYSHSYDYPWSNFLQMIVTMLIAGGICFQYWHELRRGDSKS